MLDPRVNIRFRVWLIGSCNSLGVTYPCGFQMLKPQVMAGRSEPCTLDSFSPRPNHSAPLVMTGMRESIHPDAMQLVPLHLLGGPTFPARCEEDRTSPRKRIQKKGKRSPVADMHRLREGKEESFGVKSTLCNSNCSTSHSVTKVPRYGKSSDVLPQRIVSNFALVMLSLAAAESALVMIQRLASEIWIGFRRYGDPSGLYDSPRARSGVINFQKSRTAREALRTDCGNVFVPVTRLFAWRSPGC